ncbi:MAG: hypothetical protein QOH61_582 [Chloroflexota bacterium]|nr:hypothetical protein [Chloroflexota bacterium]
MIFSLEALQAFNGDCLLLHGGTAADPKLVLIDGGPMRTWGKSLKPRFEELRSERIADGDPLPVDLAMISHIDDDHIAGMVAFTEELVAQKAAHQPPSVTVQTLWHNSFDDIVGNSAEELRTLAVDAPAGDAIADATKAVMASVPNGRTLREHAQTLGWSINDPFAALVALPADGARKIKLGGMALTVLCPPAKQLAVLDKAWEAYLKKAAKKQEADQGAAPATAKPDTSPYNLSSIVVYAECEGKTMLLTGDGLSDHIVSGMEQAGFMQDGKAHVNILKLPHHGSERNMTQAFFDAITADHYVISANGHDGNPDLSTLQMIPASRQDDDFEIHLTNDAEDDDSLEDLVTHVLAFRKEREDSGREFKLSARKDPALSLRIDLLDGA